MNSTAQSTIPKWQLPSNYMGAHWDGYHVFLAMNRDSNALDRANFDAGLKLVRSVMSKDSVPGDPDESATVQVVTENHWAVGWVRWIAIHESDTAALQEAGRIVAKMENYPVLDEELWSQYESEESNEVWKACYNPKERCAWIRNHRSEFDFRDFQDLMGCVRGNYFAGHASSLLN